AGLVPIIDQWSTGKEPQAWLFAAPAGGPLRESNWKRSVGWRDAKVAAGGPDVRVHDLRHTAASLWLAAGAGPKVGQRGLGHATAAMTMDLYGHLVDASLWQAARLIGGTTGASEPPQGRIRTESGPGRDAKNPQELGFRGGAALGNRTPDLPISKASPSPTELRPPEPPQGPRPNESTGPGSQPTQRWITWPRPPPTASAWADHAVAGCGQAHQVAVNCGVHARAALQVGGVPVPVPAQQHAGLQVP